MQIVNYDSQKEFLITCELLSLWDEQLGRDLLTSTDEMEPNGCYTVIKDIILLLRRVSPSPRKKNLLKTILERLEILWDYIYEHPEFVH
jgi:hypothetical protein